MCVQARPPQAPKAELHKRKVRVLVFSPPALAQLIGHLFRGQPEIEIVGIVGSLKRLAEESGRLLPELIVANWKPVKAGVATVFAIKKSCLSSKLILISPLKHLSTGARRGGADACLEQERLVFRLLPTVLALSATRHSSSLSSRRHSQGLHP